MLHRATEQGVVLEGAAALLDAVQNSLRTLAPALELRHSLFAHCSGARTYNSNSESEDVAAESVGRSDSGLGPLPAFLCEDGAVHGAGNSRALCTEVPDVPSPVPLPPQEELCEFDAALQAAIDAIRGSKSMSGCDAAVEVLDHVAHVADLAACVAVSWPEYWTLLVHAANLLSSVLMPEEVVVGNVLVRCLAGIARKWGKGGKRSTVEIARVAGEVFEEAVLERRKVGERSGNVFARYIREYCDNCQTWLTAEELRADLNLPDIAVEEKQKAARDCATLRILTLEITSAITAALTHALASIPNLTIALSILSSTDNCLSPPSSSELPSSLRHRLHATTHPSSAIGAASQQVDILLLDTKSIDAEGNVRCTKGALGTAVCVKLLSPRATVIVLSGVDNVSSARIGKGLVEGAASQVEQGPARFVDVYVTETGVLGFGELETLAKSAEELEKHVLGEKDRRSMNLELDQCQWVLGAVSTVQ